MSDHYQDGGGSGGIEHCALAHSPLPEHLVRSLVQCNEEMLGLMFAQSLAMESASNIFLRQFRELWRPMTQSARARMASCSYLLADLGFTDARHWRGDVHAVREAVEEDRGRPFFTVPAAVKVASMIFVFAWDLCRLSEAFGRLVLGMPAHCTASFKMLSAKEVVELAAAYSHWLVPRGSRAGTIWRDSLIAASTADLVALDRARSHGYDLMEAESRAAALEARDPSARR